MLILFSFLRVSLGRLRECACMHAALQTAGYAACMLVMAYPVVGVLWGALRFKEFGGGASRTRLACVVLQVAAYLTAVGLLAASAQLRVDGGTVDGGGHG